MKHSKLAHPAAFLVIVLMGARAANSDDRVTTTKVRAPWTSSHIAGSPEAPPPYAIEPAFPSLRFDRPVVISAAKGFNRLFVGEQGGKVFSFPNDPGTAKADLVVDLAGRTPGFTSLFGLAFHPRFEENRFAFVCYVTRDNRPDGTRISRFTVDRADPPRIDPASEQVILTWPSGGHNAGCLVFGPEGYLYASAGDAEVPSPPDPRDTGQDITDLLGSILRIDVDRQDAGRPYRVPADNPFVNLAGARPEVWAYGLRNPWRMSFDRVKGDLWVGDVGWELWELIHKVERGGNYGWSIVEGPQPVHPDGKRGPTPIQPPTVAHPHSEAASMTGGYVYRGKRLASLEGVYVYGDYQSGKVWGLRHDGQKVTWQGLLAETPLELVSFGEDNAGEIYLLDYERTRQLHRLVPNPVANRADQEFPRSLGQTGLFASTRDHIPAAGVIAYEINAPLWSDGARADRLLALPGMSKIEIGEGGRWHLPDGAVLARTVSIELERGNPASLRRMETQVLHLEGGNWRPYSYMWDDAQSDATLADAPGTNRTLQVVDRDTPGGVRSQAYRVHARAECALCHNPWVEKQRTIFGRQSASPLGLSTGQLNKELRREGVSVNQIRLFEEMGLFVRPVGASPDALARTADPYDVSANLDRRVRAYLQVNCAHCHQNGAGGSATIWLSDDLPIGKMNLVGAKPGQGSFGISDSRLIKPGDPEGSVLLYRVAKLGGGRMPRLGSNSVDDRGVALLADWIVRMPAPKGERSPGSGPPGTLAVLEAASSTPEVRAEAVRALLATTRGAMSLMRGIDRGTVTPEARGQAVALATTHTAAEVRDLFERYVPEGRRVAKLGDAFDRKTILDIKGDARRGREVFMNGATGCKSCHRLEGEGESLGPDLAHVGTRYTRPELLRQIVEPSQTIDPKFATYTVETKAGQVHSGLVAEKTDAEVVLKDTRSQTTRIPAGLVEQMTRSDRSMMPDLLLRDLTAQQAADLLDFLASLK
jgi:putative heme-binding domain-containing protein